MKNIPDPQTIFTYLIPFLVFSSLLVDRSQCAPAVEGDDVDGGCYYMFNHYGEGDRILTNEPCLNCTCHNSMLMCYLRVCPFTKPIGQDCTVEKKPDQCCPVISCPQVPVSLVTPSTLTSTTMSTTSLASVTESTELAPYERGCEIEGKYYTDGAQIIGDPSKPCELCYCIRNKTACVMQECILHVEGCEPVFQPGVCCPVRYQCDYPPQITDQSTVAGLITTTISSLFSPATLSGSCVMGGRTYADGSQIPGAGPEPSPCEHCYCMRGEIVCAVQECGAPLENEGANCTAIPPGPGLCCPEKYTCESDKDILSDDYMTTILPPSVAEAIEPETEKFPLGDDKEDSKTVSPSDSMISGDVPSQSTVPPTDEQGDNNAQSSTETGQSSTTRSPLEGTDILVGDHNNTSEMEIHNLEKERPIILTPVESTGDDKVGTGASEHPSVEGIKNSQLAPEDETPKSTENSLLDHQAVTTSTASGSEGVTTQSSKLTDEQSSDSSSGNVDDQGQHDDSSSSNTIDNVTSERVPDVTESSASAELPTEKLFGSSTENAIIDSDATTTSSQSVSDESVANDSSKISDGVEGVEASSEAPAPGVTESSSTSIAQESATESALLPGAQSVESDTVKPLLIPQETSTETGSGQGVGDSDVSPGQATESSIVNDEAEAGTDKPFQAITPEEVATVKPVAVTVEDGLTEKPAADSTVEGTATDKPADAVPTDIEATDRPTSDDIAEDGSTEKPATGTTAEDGSTNKPLKDATVEDGSTEKPASAIPVEDGPTDKPHSDDAVQDGSTEKPTAAITDEDSSTEKPAGVVPIEDGSTDKPLGDATAVEDGSTERPATAVTVEDDSTNKPLADSTGEEGSTDKPDAVISEGDKPMVSGETLPESSSELPMESSTGSSLSDVKLPSEEQVTEKEAQSIVEQPTEPTFSDKPEETADATTMKPQNAVDSETEALNEIKPSVTDSSLPSQPELESSTVKTVASSETSDDTPLESSTDKAQENLNDEAAATSTEKVSSEIQPESSTEKSSESSSAQDTTAPEQSTEQSGVSTEGNSLPESSTEKSQEAGSDSETLSNDKPSDASSSSELSNEVPVDATSTESSSGDAGVTAVSIADGTDQETSTDSGIINKITSLVSEFFTTTMKSITGSEGQEDGSPTTLSPVSADSSSSADGTSESEGEALNDKPKDETDEDLLATTVPSKTQDSAQAEGGDSTQASVPTLEDGDKQSSSMGGQSGEVTTRKPESASSPEDTLGDEAAAGTTLKPSEEETKVGDDSVTPAVDKEDSSTAKPQGHEGVEMGMETISSTPEPAESLSHHSTTQKTPSGLPEGSESENEIDQDSAADKASQVSSNDDSSSSSSPVSPVSEEPVGSTSRPLADAGASESETAVDSDVTTMSPVAGEISSTEGTVGDNVSSVGSDGLDNSESSTTSSTGVENSTENKLDDGSESATTIPSVPSSTVGSDAEKPSDDDSAVIDVSGEEGPLAGNKTQDGEDGSSASPAEVDATTVRTTDDESVKSSTSSSADNNDASSATVSSSSAPLGDDSDVPSATDAPVPVSSDPLANADEKVSEIGTEASATTVSSADEESHTAQGISHDEQVPVTIAPASGSEIETDSTTSKPVSTVGGESSLAEKETSGQTTDIPPQSDDTEVTTISPVSLIVDESTVPSTDSPMASQGDNEGGIPSTESPVAPSDDKGTEQVAPGQHGAMGDSENAGVSQDVTTSSTVPSDEKSTTDKIDTVGSQSDETDQDESLPATGESTTLPSKVSDDDSEANKIKDESDIPVTTVSSDDLLTQGIQQTEPESTKDESDATSSTLDLTTISPGVTPSEGESQDTKIGQDAVTVPSSVSNTDLVSKEPSDAVSSDGEKESSVGVTTVAPSQTLGTDDQDQESQKDDTAQAVDTTTLPSQVSPDGTNASQDDDTAEETATAIPSSPQAISESSSDVDSSSAGTTVSSVDKPLATDRPTEQDNEQKVSDESSGDSSTSASVEGASFPSDSESSSTTSSGDVSPASDDATGEDSSGGTTFAPSGTDAPSVSIGSATSSDQPESEKSPMESSTSAASESDSTSPVPPSDVPSVDTESSTAPVSSDDASNDDSSFVTTTPVSAGGGSPAVSSDVGSATTLPEKQDESIVPTTLTPSFDTSSPSAASDATQSPVSGGDTTDSISHDDQSTQTESTPIVSQQPAIAKEPATDTPHHEGEDIVPTEIKPGHETSISSLTSTGEEGSTIAPKLGSGDNKPEDTVSATEPSGVAGVSQAGDSSTVASSSDFTTQPSVSADQMGQDSISHDDSNGTLPESGSGIETTDRPATTVDESSSLASQPSGLKVQSDVTTSRPVNDFGEMDVTTLVPSMPDTTDKLFDTSSLSSDSASGESSRVPGEGSCFVEGKTYQNGTSIPPTTPCHLVCACQNSIVHCLLVHCPPPPNSGSTRDCKPIYKSGVCCPDYDCDESGSMTVTVTPGPGDKDENFVTVTPESTFAPSETYPDGGNSSESVSSSTSEPESSSASSESQSVGDGATGEDNTGDHGPISHDPTGTESEPSSIPPSVSTTQSSVFQPSTEKSATDEGEMEIGGIAPITSAENNTSTSSQEEQVLGENPFGDDMQNITGIDNSGIAPGNYYPVTTTTTVTPSSAAWPYPTSTPASVMSTGACLFDGRVYMSAQQIPRDDPCDFCFCFRGDIICLQQSCPPPIPGCYEEPIPGFCCPRYECPVGNGNGTTQQPPLFPPSYYHNQILNGVASGQNLGPPNPPPMPTGPGCEIQGEYYESGQVITSTSGPCLECRCGATGMMECDPRECQPEPMLRKMIAAITSR